MNFEKLVPTSFAEFQATADMILQRFQSGFEYIDWNEKWIQGFIAFIVLQWMMLLLNRKVSSFLLSVILYNGNRIILLKFLIML
jgi:hypothetical protein